MLESLISESKNQASHVKLLILGRLNAVLLKPAELKFLLIE